jgi:plasmid stabilization system protein ParE
MKIRFLGRSAAQARAADAWWREHRLAAPSLFADELAGALRLLRKFPGIGAPYPPKAELGVRRVLLSKTRYQLYYAYDQEKGLLGVLAIWSCLRGQPPNLRHAPRAKR